MNPKAIGKKAVHIIIYFITFFVFIMPILRLVIMSVTVDYGYGLDNFIKLLQEARTVKAIINTIMIAFFSTLISVVLGSVFAFIIAYTNIPKKRFLETLVLIPFILPSYIITLSWSNLLEKKALINFLLTSIGLEALNLYSLPGIIFVLGICNTPVVYLITIHMLRKIPQDLEWASRASGYGIFETMIKINLPQAMPAIISGGMLAFLASVDNFSVPAFLGISSGIPVLSTYIYEKAISFGPSAFNLAAALSVLLSVIAIGGILLQGKCIKKSSGSESIKEDDSIRIMLSDKVKNIVRYVCLFFLILINIVPIITMVLSSFLKNYGGFKIQNLIVSNYEFVFTNRGVRQAVFNSISLALITCIICIVIGMVLAYLKVRKKSKVVLVMESGAELTYAIPGIVLSLAMIFHWTMLADVYGTIKILIISYVTRYLILQIKGCTTAMLSVDASMEEAAMVSGSSKIRLWLKVLIPLLKKQVLSGSFLIFVSALTELTLSSMLAAAGTKTIGLTVFNLQQGGDYALAAALSTVIVMVLLMGYLGSHLFGRKKVNRNKEADSTGQLKVLKLKQAGVGR